MLNTKHSSSCDENITSITVRDPQTAIVFLTENFDFKIKDSSTDLMRCEEVMIENELGDCLLLLTDRSIEMSTPIQINVNDCIKKYSQINKNALKYLGELQYVSEGLTIDLTDLSGNRYKLLESRKYDDF